MGSFQLQLNGTTPASQALSVDSGRITVTIITAPSAANEVWATVDGSTPLPPSSTPNNTDQIEIDGVVGAQGVLELPEFGDHMAYATFQAASYGSPLIEVSW